MLLSAIPRHLRACSGLSVLPGHLDQPARLEPARRGLQPGRQGVRRAATTTFASCGGGTSSGALSRQSGSCRFSGFVGLALRVLSAGRAALSRLDRHRARRVAALLFIVLLGLPSRRRRALVRPPLLADGRQHDRSSSALAVPGVTIAALVLAAAMNRETRAMAVLRTLFFLSQVLSVTVVTLIWQIMFSPRQGLIANVTETVRRLADQLADGREFRHGGHRHRHDLVVARDRDDPVPGRAAGHQRRHLRGRRAGQRDAASGRSGTSRCRT